MTNLTNPRNAYAKKLFSPDYAVSSTANRHDRRAILVGDLKHIAENIVLYKHPSVRRRRRKIRVLAAGASHISHNLCNNLVMLLNQSLVHLLFCT